MYQHGPQIMNLMCSGEALTFPVLLPVGVSEMS